MKLFFLAEDSLYKIFKTLEKVPKGKKLEIFIDSSHSLFDNEWRGKQIKDVLEKRSLNVVFVTKTDKSKKFFEKIGLDVNHVEKNKILKVFKMIYLFVFDIKKFHLNSLKDKKSYNFFLVLGFEVLFVVFIIYLLYSLILPGAKIYINPSRQIETIIYNFRYYPNTDLDYPRYSRFISIPFYTGSLEYKHEMSINTVNVKYLQNPSYGVVKIYNKTNRDYTLVPNTRFITDDGRLFQTTTWIEIPAGYNGVPGEVEIRLKAMERDDDGILMGNRGNIDRGTNLYIKNLKQSFFLKDIFAVAVDDFTGGTLSSEGLVTQGDIDLLNERMLSYIEQQKKNIVRQNFNVKDSILLAFENTIFEKTKSIEVKSSIGEDTPTINGHIISEIDFLYIKWDDLIRGFSSYVNQRPSDKSDIFNIDKNSLVFFEEDEIREKDGTFIAPTKIDVIQGYDFKKDVSGIIDEMKSQIVSMDRESARSYILSFPEVSSVRIKITPAWYNNVPKLKSRIKAYIEN